MQPTSRQAEIRRRIQIALGFTMLCVSVALFALAEEIIMPTQTLPVAIIGGVLTALIGLFYAVKLRHSRKAERRYNR